MQDAMEALKRATHRYRKTEAAHDAARTEAVYAVVEALRAGIRPTEVTAASPFEAAYVRRLARKNGIKPARGSQTGSPTSTSQAKTEPQGGNT